jgi:hypothetical protein
MARRGVEEVDLECDAELGGPTMVIVRIAGWRQQRREMGVFLQSCKVFDELGILQYLPEGGVIIWYDPDSQELLLLLLAI